MDKCNCNCHCEYCVDCVHKADNTLYELETQTAEHLTPKPKEIVNVPTDEDINESLVERAKPFASLITLIVGLLLAFLSETFGYELQYTPVQVVEGIGIALTIIGGLWSWYKNNNVTKEAKKRDYVSRQVFPKKAKPKIK